MQPVSIFEKKGPPFLFLGGFLHDPDTDVPFQGKIPGSEVLVNKRGDLLWDHCDFFFFFLS